ncbi:MAG: exopolysaccharide biosynthesis protein [Kiritimatiellia bacterium]|jgi:hypothetical protein
MPENPDNLQENLKRDDDPVVAVEATIADKLDAVIEDLPTDSVSVADIRDRIGDESILMLSALLCIIFLVPVSIPGVSTVFGAAILLGGISRCLQRKLWLPKSVAGRELAADKVKAALKQGSSWLHRLEKVSKPGRHQRFLASGPVELFNSFGIVLGAVLLMAPFGLIPFSNTLPAIAVLLLCIGLLQRDGLCVLLGHIMNLVTMLYFAILVFLAFFLVGSLNFKALWDKLFG